jgi:hypothetical protein
VFIRKDLKKAALSSPLDRQLLIHETGPMRQGKVNHFGTEMRLECGKSRLAERGLSTDGTLIDITSGKSSA